MLEKNGEEYLGVWLVFLYFEAVCGGGFCELGGSGILADFAPIVAVNSALKTDQWDLHCEGTSIRVRWKVEVIRSVI